MILHETAGVRLGRIWHAAVWTLSEDEPNIDTGMGCDFRREVYPRIEDGTVGFSVRISSNIYTLTHDKRGPYFGQKRCTWEMDLLERDEHQ